MKKVVLFFSMVVGLCACQYKLDNYVNVVGQTFLSIEGGVSDKVEQQTIRLFYTSSKIDGSGSLSPVAGAKVYVTDEKGATLTYIQTGLGLYQTAQPVAGRVGGIYTLHMEINGKSFVSAPETLHACPEIDRIYTETTIKSSLPKTSPYYGGFDVNLSFKDPIEPGNYYRWVWKHYDKVDVCTTCKGRAWDDNTNSCNDANAARYAQNFIQHCRTSCFDVTYSSDFNLMSDDYINGEQVAKVFIARAPYQLDENYISGYKYFYTIEQRAINKDTYELFNLLKQSGNSGTFFDVPALSKFNLNISCTNDPSQKILGVFEVYGVKSKPFIVDMSVTIPGVNRVIIPTPVETECPLLPCTAPCIESLLRTRTTPEGWVD